MINDFSEGFVKCGHAMLYYRSYGDGVPLIMLHGNMQSAKLFHKQLVFFTDTCRVITIDSRGHGKSSHGKKRLSINLMAEDIITVMNELGIEKAAFIGFSDGANIALKIACHHPHNVLAMILIGANTKADGLKSFIRIPAKIGYAFLRCISFCSFFNRMAQKLSLIVNSPNISQDHLDAISIPSLFIAGSRDVIKEEHTKHIAEQVSSSKLYIVKDGGHNLLKQKPDEINEVMKKFLQDVFSNRKND